MRRYQTQTKNGKEVHVNIVKTGKETGIATVYEVDSNKVLGSISAKQAEHYYKYGKTTNVRAWVKTEANGELSIKIDSVNPPTQKMLKCVNTAIQKNPEMAALPHETFDECRRLLNAAGYVVSSKKAIKQNVQTTF